MLESYKNAIWVPDNTVAMASIKMHGQNTGKDYQVFLNSWLEYVKEHYTDLNTNVLCSTVNPTTGLKEEEPRGSMLGWSINFIYQIDSTYAVNLYDNYKDKFSLNLGLFRIFKERYKKNETNMGDIDSGPLFLGYSIPANEFALSNAVLAKDYSTARKIKRLVNFGAKKIINNDELSYKVRFIDMEISPNFRSASVVFTYSNILDQEK
jgi:hypothetical protein